MIQKKALFGIGEKQVEQTVGTAKDAVIGAFKRFAPIILLAPPAIGFGAAYAASRMTSPSKEDEDALSAELEQAEYQRMIGDLARIRALARMQGKKKPQGAV